MKWDSMIQVRSMPKGRLVGLDMTSVIAKMMKDEICTLTKDDKEDEALPLFLLRELLRVTVEEGREDFAILEKEIRMEIERRRIIKKEI